MKRKYSPVLTAIALTSLLTVSVLMTGCGQTETKLTPEQQASFGKYGQPMPASAKASFQEWMSKGKAQVQGKAH